MDLGREARSELSMLILYRRLISLLGAALQRLDQGCREEEGGEEGQSPGGGFGPLPVQLRGESGLF